MDRLSIIILIFVVGILVWAFGEARLITTENEYDKDRIDIMRIASGKQDDVIRKKQNRIDELERDARKEKRK